MKTVRSAEELVLTYVLFWGSLEFAIMHLSASYNPEHKFFKSKGPGVFFLVCLQCLVDTQICVG